MKEYGFAIPLEELEVDVDEAILAAAEGVWIDVDDAKKKALCECWKALHAYLEEVIDKIKKPWAKWLAKFALKRIDKIIRKKICEE